MRRTKTKDGTTVLDGGALTLASAMNIFFPVNSILMTTDNVNPGTRFPGTTWVAWGAGRAVVGVGSNGTNTYTSEQTFGADSISLTDAQSGVNAHTHSQTLAAPAHTHTMGNHSHSLSNHKHGSDAAWTGFVTYLSPGAGHKSFTSGSGLSTIGSTSSSDTGQPTQTDVPSNNTSGTPSTNTSDGASATALTGSMGAVTGNSAATAHENRQTSIATYLWKRTV